MLYLDIYRCIAKVAESDSDSDFDNDQFCKEPKCTELCKCDMLLCLSRHIMSYSAGYICVSTEACSGDVDDVLR